MSLFSQAEILYVKCPYCDGTGLRNKKGTKKCQTCDGQKYMKFCDNCEEYIKPHIAYCSGAKTDSGQCDRKSTGAKGRLLPPKASRNY